jgi:tetratricopeptide (TPR) repeat protein
VAAAQLRLAIARAGLGIELAEPVRVGCLHVAELELAITTVRFPLDVSGGVGRFRHRRGELQRVLLEVGARDLERWAAPILRGLLGPRAPEVWVGVRRGGATIAIVEGTADGTSAASPQRGLHLDATSAAAAGSSPRVLAFELSATADGDDLHVCVTRARGAGLPSPATTLALRAAKGLLGPSAVREGSHFVLRRVSRSIARAVLPDAGVRAPSTEGMRWTALTAQGDHWIAIAARDGAPAEATGEAALAMETCAITREADDARWDGDLDRARRLDVDALERAPRHPEVARRIAEIDQLAGGRAEAALATLAASAQAGADAEPPGAAPQGDPLHGLLEGELLAEMGDTQAALASLVRVGETEPVPALAARAYQRASELTRDPLDALAWLDLAIARAPGLATLRWTRLARRLSVGRFEDALADAEHLEAQAQGGRARHAVWRRAGDAWVSAGLRAHAAPLYERALRFEPDDPEAIAGLGVCLVEAGRVARGAALLAHAIEIGQQRGLPAQRVMRMTIELAQVLAHPLEDRPAAIARVRSVPNDAPLALLARTLEGRWRAELGDLAGASFAYARLRDLASSRAVAARPAEARETDEVVQWLVEGATFERDRREDPLAAQRLLAAALRLAPRDAVALRAYREVGLEIMGRPAPAAGPPGASPGAVADSGQAIDLEAVDSEESEREESEPEEDAGESGAGGARVAFKTEPPKEGFVFDLEPAGSPAVSLLPAVSLSYPGEAEDAARVDELSRLLQSDPTQDAIVDELAQRLTRLGRTHELLALLSARLEDASPQRRVLLVPQQRAVLERLEQDARIAGRDLEAAFFRDAVKMLSSL